MYKNQIYKYINIHCIVKIYVSPAMFSPKRKFETESPIPNSQRYEARKLRITVSIDVVLFTWPPPVKPKGWKTPPPHTAGWRLRRALGASPICFLLISWARHKIWTQNHFRGKTLAFFSTAKSTSPIKYMAKFGTFYQTFSEIQGSPFGNVCQFKWVSV